MPWHGKELETEEYYNKEDRDLFLSRCYQVQGIYCGSCDDLFRLRLIPEKWDIKTWQFVSIIIGTDPRFFLDRLIIGDSCSMKGKPRGKKTGWIKMRVEIEDLGEGTLIETRTGIRSSPERYQRIFRLDPDGWHHVAYRQNDVYNGGKMFFYPWTIIIKLKEK